VTKVSVTKVTDISIRMRKVVAMTLVATSIVSIAGTAWAMPFADGAAIKIHNERGQFHARARVTEKIPAGTVWMRDGWEGLNRLTSGDAAIPDEAVDLFGFSGGQAAFDAMVDVAPA